MISYQHVKAKIDLLPQHQLETLDVIISTLLTKSIPSNKDNTHLLKNSIVFEKDIISPIDEKWDVEL